MSTRQTAARRIRALDLLERVKRHEMEDELRELARINGKIAETRAQREELDRRLREETRSRDLEVAPYIAGFARAMREQIAGLDGQLEKLATESRTLDDFVRERYREARTYASVADRLRQEARQEAARREAKDLDEIALTLWQRASAG